MVWMYNTPKSQSSWEVPYSVVKRINDVVYHILRGPQPKLNDIHLHRLAPYEKRKLIGKGSVKRKAVLRSIVGHMRCR